MRKSRDELRSPSGIWQWRVRSAGDGTWTVEVEVEYRPGYTAVGKIEHFGSREEARRFARMMRRKKRRPGVPRFKPEFWEG